MRSEIPIRNLYYMLAYAYRALRQQNYASLETEPFETASDLLAAILIKEVSQQLRQGLSREYLPVEERISTVRGRISMPGTMAERFKNTGKLCCQFDLLLENTLLNQITKTAAFLLFYKGELKRENRAALRRLLPYFEGVDTLRPRDIAWERLTFRRETSTYQLLVGICYLVLHDLVQSTKEGELRLRHFFDEQSMARLFEKFVLAYYARHWPGLRPKSREIPWAAEGMHPQLPRMHCDICLTQGRKLLIIDTKYYGQSMQENLGSPKLHSANLYQIYTYVKNAADTEGAQVNGLLLYAKTGESIVPAFSSKIGGSWFFAKALDLSGPFPTIAAQLDALVKLWSDAK